MSTMRETREQVSYIPPSEREPSMARPAGPFERRRERLKASHAVVDSIAADLAAAARPFASWPPLKDALARYDALHKEAGPIEHPVRLCCGKRHLSVQCPDKLTQCCLCWERFPADGLNMVRGIAENVCLRCAEEEERNRHE